MAMAPSMHGPTGGMLRQVPAVQTHRHESFTIPDATNSRDLCESMSLTTRDLHVRRAAASDGALQQPQRQHRRRPRLIWTSG